MIKATLIVFILVIIAISERSGAQNLEHSIEASSAVSQYQDPTAFEALLSADGRRLFVESWGEKVTAYNLIRKREEFNTDNSYTELGLIEEKNQKLLLISAGEYYDLQTNRYCFH